MSAANHKVILENQRYRIANAMADVCLILNDRDKVNEAIAANILFSKTLTANEQEYNNFDWLEFMYSKQFDPAKHLICIHRIIGIMERALDKDSLKQYNNIITSETPEQEIESLREIVILNSVFAYVESEYMIRDAKTEKLLHSELHAASTSHNDKMQAIIAEELKSLKDSELVITRKGAIKNKFALISILLSNINERELARLENKPAMRPKSLSKELIAEIITTTNYLLNKYHDLLPKNQNMKFASLWKKPNIRNTYNTILLLMKLVQNYSLSEAERTLDAAKISHLEILTGRGPAQKVIRKVQKEIEHDVELSARSHYPNKK